MKFYGIFLFITIVLAFFLSSSTGQRYAQPRRVLPKNYVPPENGDKIDMDYLGYKIYGLPNRESGRRVAQWHKNLGINPEELGTYIEGDILFSTPTEKAAFVPEYYRWPGGVIPYQITGRFSATDRQVIMAAMNDFHKYTCVRFVPQTTQYPYIRITSEYKGCYSAVGHSGNIYDLNLQTPGCTTQKGTVIHELMHAAGFLHEQSRSDRDNYVHILWDNIQPEYKNNFQNYKKEDLNEYGVSYDYNSIMHYSGSAFTANGQPTIIPKSANIKLGQRIGFSQSDVDKLNRMYKCNARQPQNRKQEKSVPASNPITPKTRKPTIQKPTTQKRIIQNPRPQTQPQWRQYCYPNGYCYWMWQ